MTIFYQNRFYAPKIRPLKLYEKIGITLLAIPVVLFIVIPSLIVLTILWLKNMRIIRKTYEQSRKRSSGPQEPEIILPNQKRLHQPIPDD